MKILNRVPNSPTYFSRHNDIVEAKKNPEIRSSLNAISDQVEARYQTFQNELIRRNLHRIKKDNLMLENKDHLLSCFINKTQKTLAIFKAIKDAQDNGTLSKCPYCGITRPHTYDHYLPESHYPEFSVHTINLVPCCSTCNSSKGNTLVSDGERCYLHFYSDILPDEQFLFVTIETHPNCLAYGCHFYLKKPLDFNDADWQIINNHFSKLKLIQRYNNEANDEVDNYFSTAKSFVKNGGNDIQQFLHDICHDESIKLGNHHWRVILKRALAQNHTFINNVISDSQNVAQHRENLG